MWSGVTAFLGCWTSQKSPLIGERRKRWNMEVTREDLQEFRNWLDGTSDDFDEEVVKSDVE